MLSTNRLEGFQTKEEWSPATKGVENRVELVMKPDHVSTSLSMTENGDALVCTLASACLCTSDQ
jgi:hypothetical protein